MREQLVRAMIAQSFGSFKSGQRPYILVIPEISFAEAFLDFGAPRIVRFQAGPEPGFMIPILRPGEGAKGPPEHHGDGQKPKLGGQPPYPALAARGLRASNYSVGSPALSPLRGERRKVRGNRQVR